MEAQLHARPEGRSTLSSLNDPLSLFPFRLARVGCRQALSLSDRLELFPDGSGDEMIGLHTYAPLYAHKDGSVDKS